jgi:O-antigen/teichoic acid export membrane protein
MSLDLGSAAHDADGAATFDRAAAIAEQTGGKQLASAGAVLTGAMLVANAGNYAVNIALGRWLSPALFADANLMVTLMLLVTAIAVSLQLITARYAGIDHAMGTVERTPPLVRWLGRLAAAGGAVVGLALVAGAPLWHDVFRTRSSWPFAILGVGMPCYLVQAVHRGKLQGKLAMRPLALTFIVEMVVRVAVAVTLVALGFGVEGATIGLTASFVATWLIARHLAGRPENVAMPAALRRDVSAYARPIALLLLGQIVINNGDVLIAKHYLTSDRAGVYSAIALIGRAVFFLSWSVATTLFPAAAQRHAAGHDTNRLLRAGAATVTVMGMACAGGAWWLGSPVLGTVFGPAYDGVGRELSLYALATTMFAVANLAASHHLSAGRSLEARIVLAGGAVQTVLLMAWHRSIGGLIRAQLVSMAILLLAIGLAQFRKSPIVPKNPTNTLPEM